MKSVTASSLALATLFGLCAASSSGGRLLVRRDPTVGHKAMGQRLAARSGAEPSAVEKRGSSYMLVRESRGATFFDDWDFWTDADPTHGQVDYVSQSDAAAAGLIAIRKNSLTNSTLVALSRAPQTAVMRVDYKTSLAAGKNRKSVRITSKAAFTKGLLILDAVRMPYGCSVWPAFWTVGTNWPNNGEIDIVEGVNKNVQNTMTLHTKKGCTLKTPMSGAGTVLTTNCDANVNYNTGCSVQDKSNVSYGPGFNAAGGGVFAMEWTDKGVAVWRFARDNVPKDIYNLAPNPANWGKPRGFWSSSTCNPSTFFGPQNVVFDITLCGDWAGSSYAADGCPGTCSSAVANPNNFKNAAWEVASVRLYQ